MADGETTDLTTLTVQLLSAYLGNNSIPSNELGDLIQSTRAALAEQNAPAAPVASEEFKPAVSVRKSLASGDHILSMIDGRPYKTLKRHLKSHGLTPAEYRERYKLPRDYPLVASNYSDHRREVARRLGLGRKPPVADEAPAAEAPAEAAPAEAPAPAPAETTPVENTAPAPKPRGRPKAAAAQPAAEAPAETADAPAPARRGRKPAAKAEATAEAPPAAPAPRRRKNAASSSDNGAGTSRPRRRR